MTDLVGEAWVSIWIFVGALCVALALSRRRHNTLGMPVAYLLLLALNHLPGAYAFVVSGGYQGQYGGLYTADQSVVIGVRITAIAAICFVFGVLLGGSHATRRSKFSASPIATLADEQIWQFCVVGGWLTSFGLVSLRSIPSVGAAINYGSSIWMLGVMLGLAQAIRTTDKRRMVMWTMALFVYPIMMLISGGFLSYGAAATIVVASFVFVSFRYYLTSIVAIVAAFFVGITIFVNWYVSRTSLREVLWSDAGYQQRVDAASDVFGNIKMFDPTDPTHIAALEDRLNQNAFVGLAATRLDRGEVDYLYGKSFWEGMIALVPRWIWPDKPVYGGSPRIVADMTGLPLSENTSWGVGNVMEFYINFGYVSLVIGFVLLGALISRLDTLAYRATSERRYGDAFVTFLPCVALIQPGGSLVEFAGGAAAAWVAAWGWRIFWSKYTRSKIARRLATYTWKKI